LAAAYINIMADGGDYRTDGQEEEEEDIDDNV
jgi:hypothetical protein